MDSSLKSAYKIKLHNFEGPFDLLFHLIEKNQMDIYDIPIKQITDQYMEYLFTLKKMDLEIASEFVVMAANLLHIKSKMLLPKEKKLELDEPEYINQTENDPREELVSKLIQYKKYKEFSYVLRQHDEEFGKIFYKIPEIIDFHWERKPLILSPDDIKKHYLKIVKINELRLNDTSKKMSQILQHEKVSLKAKMKDVLRSLFDKAFMIFSEIFCIHKKSKLEVVTGFLAILELSKLKKVNLIQKKLFGEIFIYKVDDTLEEQQIS